MNASCTNVRELIPLFPDDLDTNETALVRSHVADCSACAAELGVYAAQAACFAQVREGREKVDLFAGIQAKLAQPEPRGEVIRPRFGLGSLVAAAAAGIVVAFGLFSMTQSERKAPAPENPTANNTPAQPKAPEKAPTIEKKDTSLPVAIDPKKGRGNRSPRRRIFDANDAFFGNPNPNQIVGGERELTPLDEEAEIPQAQPRKRHFVAPQATPGPAPKASDDESLRF